MMIMLMIMMIMIMMMMMTMIQPDLIKPFIFKSNYFISCCTGWRDCSLEGGIELPWYCCHVNWLEDHTRNTHMEWISKPAKRQWVKLEKTEK